MTRPIAEGSGSSVTHDCMTSLLLENIQLQTDLTERLFASMSNAYLPSASTSRQRSQAQQNPLSRPQAVTEIYSALQQASEEQAVLLERARRHQEKWNKLERKKRRVDDLEDKVREILMTLEKGSVELGSLIDEGKETIKTIDGSALSETSAPDIITYATHLAPFTSRPVQFSTPPTILPPKLLNQGSSSTDRRASSSNPAVTNPRDFVYPVELIIRQGRLAAAASQEGMGMGMGSGMMGGMGDVGIVGEGAEGLALPGQGMVEDPILPPSALDPPVHVDLHPSLPPEPPRPVVPARPFKLGLEDSDDEDD